MEEAIPEGPDRTVLGYLSETILYFLSHYAWNVLAFVVIAALLWANFEPYVYDYIFNRKNKKNVMETLSPAKAEKIQLGHEEARRKMQEEYDRKVQEKKQKQSEAAATGGEVNEFAALAQGTTTEKKETKTKSVKRPFKPEYNPLMGGQSNFQQPPRYRPGTNRYPARGG